MAFATMGALPANSPGISVSSAGDVNGDGFDDIIIGANGIKSSPKRTTSAVLYIVFGKASGFGDPINLNAQATGCEDHWRGGKRPHRRTGSWRRRLQRGRVRRRLDPAYASIPMRGGAYVVFGGSSLARNIGLGSLNGSTGFTILAARTFAGMSVATPAM